MQATGYAVYIVIGSILGSSYGLLFLLQKRGALSHVLSAEEVEKQKWFSAEVLGSCLATMLRLLLLAIAWLYLLPLETIPFILVLISFFVFFGIVIHKGTGVKS
jgi:hypothetical protein